MYLKKNNLNKPKTKENELTKTNINLNSKFQILTSDARGITLIALVITIIVMLILVAVTIRVATEGNLFKHAGNAVKDTKNAVLQENYLGDGRVTVGGQVYNSIEEYVATKTGEEAGGTGGGGGATYTAYSIGDEVVIDNEHFYVIEDSGTSSPTVKLLAKYYLKAWDGDDSTAILDTVLQSEDDFSSSMFDYASFDSGSVYNYNTATIKEYVDAYGSRFGVSYPDVRLMTYSEALALARLCNYDEVNGFTSDFDSTNIYGQILYMTYADFSGFNKYWLETPYLDPDTELNEVYAVYADDGCRGISKPRYRLDVD